MDKRIPLKDFRERLKLMGTPVVLINIKAAKKKLKQKLLK
jgi:hypothetical protein